VEKKLSKQVKMPKWLVSQIDKAAKAESSSFSQFLRTAAIEKINREKRVL
jgi:metal-responsive CopG/Arc/MetJ family transcriptional regulator